MASSSSCCAQLSTNSNLNVAYPNTTAYIAAERGYWSLQEASLTPFCITKPTCASDVAEIVAKLVASNCQFAIKGHGHAPAAGFANIDYGVTIDMTGLSSISVNADHSIASVGAGASWLDVYAFLDSLSKTVAGGRNGAVGIGGLTLGGGISYFSPKVGWTCDTVVNFEIVLSSGHVVDANRTSHPDLFRALKGGMNNFGVVTRFDFSTLPIGEILAGNIANNISYRHAVFDAFVDITTAQTYDVHASLVTTLAFSSTTKTWSLSSTPIYTKPITNPPVYHDLLAIPNISNTMHITPLHTLANETATPQIDFLFWTGTYAPSTDLMTRIFDIANTTFSTSAAGITWLVTFEPLPSIIASRGAGQNVLGTSAADGNSMVLLLTGVWSNASSTTEVQDTAKNVMDRIDDAARQMGALKRLRYANYANERQDVIGSYGSENQGFLRDVKARYGGWEGLVPGGFKL